MADVTQILQAIEMGEVGQSGACWPLSIPSCGRWQRRKCLGKNPVTRWCATALVHEAYLRLVGSGNSLHFQTRGHFFAAVAEVMRRILIDHARRKHSQKRGGGAHRVEMPMDGLPAQLATDQWLDLDEALTRLESIEPEIARLVKLRYFAGLTIKDAAESLGISTRSAVSWWTYARTWLAKELQRE